MLQDEGRLEEAEALLQQTLEAARQSPAPRVRELGRHVSLSLAGVLRSRLKLDAAEEMVREHPRTDSLHSHACAPHLFALILDAP